MLERLWGKGNTIPLLVGIQTCTDALEISMAISQKIRKQPTSGPNNTTFGIYPKDAQIIPQVYVFNYVHSSFICYSQNLNAH